MRACCQAVQDRRLQVVNVNRGLDDVVEAIIGLTQPGPGFHAPPAIHIVKQRGRWLRPQLVSVSPLEIDGAPELSTHAGGSLIRTRHGRAPAHLGLSTD